MNIGDREALARLQARAIRFYEDIGLVRPHRGVNGYRDFAACEVHKLVSLGRARSLSFLIEDCRRLMALHEDEGRSSAKVRQLASYHLDRITRKIAGLEAMRSTLARLVESCQGDARPDCPTIDDLAGAMDGTGS